MKGTHHLFVGFVCTGVLVVLLTLFTSFSIFEHNIVHVVLSVYVFSLLPDIDSSTSKISKMFFFVYVGLFVWGGFDVFRDDMVVGLGKVIGSIFLAFYHLSVAENSRRHRKFPHSFTFGILCSVGLGLIISVFMGVLGFFCFVVHLICDGYVIGALRQDSRFWKKVFFLK